MSLYVLPTYSGKHGRPLKDKFYDPELLKQQLGMEEISPKLLGLLAKGPELDIFVWSDPYSAEINEVLRLRGGTDRETELHSYHCAREDI